MKTIRPGFALPRALLFFFLVLTPAVRMAAADPAVATLRTKAEAGNNSAQYYLGLTYAEGRAVPRDPVEAYVWLSLAAENGSTGKALGVLVAEMTPDQLAAGRVRLEARRRTTPGVISLPRIGPPAVPVENDSGTIGQEAGIVPVDKSNLSDELAAAWKEADGAKAAATAAEQRARQAEAGLNQRAKDLIVLQTERDQLRRQLAAAPAAPAVDALQQDRDKLASRLATANTDMQSLRERMANMEAENDGLEQAATGAAQTAAGLAAMQQDRDKQARSLAAAQTAATELTTQLKKLGEEKAALVQANARLEEQARTSARRAGDEASARAEQAHRALDTTLADQTQKLAALTTELAATRQNLAVAEAGQAQATQLAAESAAARKERLAVQGTNADLNAQVRKLTEDRESFGRQLAAANQKLEEQARLAAQVTADRAAAVAKAEEQTQALSAKIAERDGQLAAAQADQAQTTKLAAAFSAARKELAAVQSTNADLAVQLKKLTDENAILSQQASPEVASLKTRLGQAESDLSTARARNAELVADSQKLEERIHAADVQSEETTRTKTALASVEQRARQAETALDQRDKDLAVLQADLQNTRRTVKDLDAAQAAIAQAAATAEQNRRERDDLRQQLEAARKESAAARNSGTELAAQLKKQTEEYAALNHQLADQGDANRELAALRAKLEGGGSDLEKLHSRNAELAAANQKLEEQARLASQVTADRAAAVAKAEEQHQALDAKIAERDGQLAAAQADQAQTTKLAAAFSAARKELAAVQSTNADLAVQLKKLTDQNAILTQQAGRSNEASPEVASLKTKLGQAESDLNTARARNAELVADSQKLEEQVHAADMQADETTRTKTALASVEQRARQAETTLGQRDKDLAVLQADLENTRRAVKDLDAAQAAATAEQNRRERDDLRQQLEAARKESAAARNSGTELAAQLKKQTEEYAALNRQLADQGDAATRLASVTGQLDDTRKELAALKNSQAELNESIRRLTEERGRWQTQIAAADTAKAEAARLQAEVAALTRQDDAARKDLTSAQTAAASRAGENTRQLAELNVQLQQAKQELAELRTQNQSLQETGRRLERQGKESTEAAHQLAEAQTSIEQLKHENAGLQAERTALDARLARAVPLAAATAPLTEAPTAVGPGDEVARLKEELGRAEAKVEMTVRSFALAQQENERLKAQLEQAGPSAPQAHNAAATPAIAQLDFARVRADADKTAAEAASLRESLRQLQNSNANLAAENARLRTTMARAGGNLPAGSRAQPGRPAAVTAAITPAAAPVDSASPPAPAPHMHRVVSGDTLTRISSRYYGTPSRWQEIYNANRDKLSSADALPLDVELKIP